MLDKETRRAIGFLKTIGDFLSDSELAESNFDILQHLCVECGYTPYASAPLSSSLVADIINSAFSSDYDHFDPHVKDILRRIERYHQETAVCLNEDLVDMVIEEEFSALEEEWDEYLSLLKPVTTSEYLNKALFYIQQEDYDSCLKCYIQAVKDGRNSLAEFKGLTLVLLKMGRISEAAEWYQKALDVMAHDSNVHERFEFHFDVGVSLKERGYYLRAVEQFSFAVKSIKKVMLYAPIACEDGNLTVEADDKTTLDSFDIIEYISKVLSSLEGIPLLQGLPAKKARILSDIRIVALKAERAVSEGLIK